MIGITDMAEIPLSKVLLPCLADALMISTGNKIDCRVTPKASMVSFEDLGFSLLCLG